MKVLLVIALILVGVVLANILSNKKLDEGKNKKVDKKKRDEELKKKSMKLKEFLASVRDLDPEIELTFLLSYLFESELAEEDYEKIETRLIGFATNHAYYIIEYLLNLKSEDGDIKVQRVEYLEALILDTGFPSVLGLSKSYLEHIQEDYKRQYLITLLSQFKPINILKFIEYVEEDIQEEDRSIFLLDRKQLENQEQRT